MNSAFFIDCDGTATNYQIIYLLANLVVYF